MKNGSAFWAEMKCPTGRQFHVEARTLRELVSHIRFFAATENARLLTQGAIPENSAACPRCHGLFVHEDGTPENLCPECLEELSEGESP